MNLAKLFREKIIGLLVAIISVSSMVAIYRLIFTGVNATTVSLSLLLVVLFIASIYGLAASIFASFLSMFAFNFFFLPPVGTLTVEDPQNWIALTAFLITAIIASQLSTAAHSRAEEAEKRREEVWKLFQLGREIIATPDSETAHTLMARQVSEIFKIDHCAVILPADNEHWQVLSTTNEENFSEKNLQARYQKYLLSAFQEGEILFIKDSDHQSNHSNIQQLIIAPLKVGVKSTGVMIFRANNLERGVIEAISGLVALALERARFLQEVSYTEALKQSDKLKSAVLASVSHNLRTPLTAIRTSIDSLMQENIKWDLATMKEFHLIISEETYRLTRIVENLLDMARIDAGELHPKKEWCSVNEIINDVLTYSQAVLRDHQVKVKLPEIEFAVRIDTRLIAEVLINLLENAVKYSPLHSNITITGDIVDGILRLSVSDEGPGIIAEEREQIFNKFYRGAETKTKTIPGTGMGLAIARGIVEAHGGKIWVENDSISKGAKFTFTLPVETKKLSEIISLET